jgi:Zn-dependent metalloprotease
MHMEMNNKFNISLFKGTPMLIGCGGHDQTHGHGAGCCCFIIPVKVLKRFAKDTKLPSKTRKAFADAAKYEEEWRKLRIARVEHTLAVRAILPTGMTAAAAARPPAVTVFDCHNGTTLPGSPVPNPGASPDGSAKRAFVEATAVADFYQQAFGRNSVDNSGMTLVSSVNYSVDYNNAFWNGSQMVYGDGDGKIFIDFTKSNDVIGHELTHGVTQYSAGLSYTNQAGGLNESISDVFGSMFRQWQASQDVNQADWLIGSEIMGPGARARGFTCLRDMSNPAANHCLSPQPTKFSQYRDGMDPHDSSGIPNFAFYKAAKAIGGKSWEKAGKIWYQALTGFPPSPNMKMRMFANRTRNLAASLFAGNVAIKTAVDQAWRAVGL